MSDIRFNLDYNVKKIQLLLLFLQCFRKGAEEYVE